MITLPLRAFTIDALTPEALTAMLGRQVASVSAAPVGPGQMACSYRLRLEYDGAEGPTTVVAKLPSQDGSSRETARMSGAYLREVRFYDEFAEDVSTRTPTCYYSWVSDDTLDFVLLLEDLGDPSPVDQIGGCTVDQAALALEQAAALHGPSWRSPALAATWLPVKEAWSSFAGLIPDATGPFLERFADYLDDEQAATISALGTHVRAWLETLDDHRCLWHGDYRLDNMLFDGHGADGSPVALTVVDWQSTAAAPGIIDVSYFIGTSLPAELAAQHEGALVTAYHQRLVDHGVRDYSADQCWSEYRAHAIYGLVLIVPIALGVARSERGDLMFGTMARRVASQIRRLDSYSALAELAGPTP